MIGRATCLRRDENGSAAIEAALGIPAFGLFVTMIVLAGRVELAKQAVDAAAYDAARAASIERSQAEAIAAGSSAASSSLEEQNAHCVAMNVVVDASAFDAPLGVTGQVTTTVTCRVDLSELSIPGVPGSRTIVATASSPVDAYRQRP